MKHTIRTPSNLSTSLQRRLNAYALAASAAGVGLTALSQPVEAKIVYTPAHIQIPVNGGLVELDLNHDGINDFAFQETYKSRSNKGYHFHYSKLEMYPGQNFNREVKYGTGQRIWAAALPKGARIDQQQPLAAAEYRVFMARATYDWSNHGIYGPWANKHNNYLGLAFLIEGKLHFGWARFDVKAHSGGCPGICATLTGYAYETVPAKPIVAGKTKGKDEFQKESDGLSPEAVSDIPTLGRLAQGASGVSAWRGRAPE